MDNIRTISGNSEQEIWQVIESDLSSNDLLDYDVLIHQGDKKIYFSIEIDLGGGFEGGYELTRLKAPVSVNDNLRFAVHHEGFVDELGKFLGIEDVEIGYPDLDDKVIIKTNDAKKVLDIFEEQRVRQVFANLQSFDLAIHHHTDHDTGISQKSLELNIDEGDTDPAALREIYHSFYQILTGLERL